MVASCDDNTKFFQSYAKSRKMQNTIWELKNSNNEVCSSFEDLVEISKSHFEMLFKVENQARIVEVIQISQFFPGQISKEDNMELQEEISEDELKEIMHTSRRIKSLVQMNGSLNFF